MKTKVLIFDFDDTLGCREKYCYRTFCEILDRVAPGLDPWEREMILQQMMIYDQNGTVPRAYIRERLLEKFGIELGEDIQECWNATQWRNTVLYSDTREVLEELKRRGYRLAVLTNGSLEGQSGKLRQSGLLDLLEEVLISGQTRYKKPDPRIFRQLMDKMGVTPQECVFVGDQFRNDIYGAHEAGIRPIWFWPHGYREVSVEVERISSLSELLDLFPAMDEKENEG